ncbi:hypothetical protein O9929_16180 [Vibrio lentus]|nr:hypothetical protein [Vibrio lentus]
MTDNQFVHAGDLLVFIIDGTDYNNMASDATLYVSYKADTEGSIKCDVYRRDSKLLSLRLISPEQVMSEKLQVDANRATGIRRQN